MSFRKALLMGLVVSTGCAHRPPVQRGSYTLEGKSGYSLLVPSLASPASDPNFQTTIVSIGVDQQKMERKPNESCAIRGNVFSLSVMEVGSRNQWIVRSLSTQGWLTRGAELNIHAEWTRFIQDLQRLEREGCFPRKETFFALRRAIAEEISVPATEAAFFLYSFGGTGFVDLAPGMEVRFERPFVRAANSTSKAVYGGSLEADYRVTSPTGADVALQLSRATKVKAARSPEAGRSENIFDLPNRFRSKSMLRLFLQTMGDGKDAMPAILLGANSVQELDEATTTIEKNGRAKCPDALGSQGDCILFGSRTAVSLMSSINVNGKAQMLPFGMSLGQMIDVSSRSAGGHALETVSLSRSLVSGSYAEIRFPRTMEAVQQIVLLPGDRLTWR